MGIKRQIKYYLECDYPGCPRITAALEDKDILLNAVAGSWFNDGPFYYCSIHRDIKFENLDHLKHDKN